MHIFRQFQDHNSEREHLNWTKDSTFSTFFFRSNKQLFLNSKILKIQFHAVPPLVHSGLQNISIFGQQLPISADHYTFPESRHPDVTRNLFCVLSTRQRQIVILLGSRPGANTHEKKFGPTKFPQEKTLDPPKGMIAQQHQTHETCDSTRPTKFSTLFFE